MINSSIIFIGLDTHKEFVGAAYVEDDRNARSVRSQAIFNVFVMFIG